MITTTMSAFTRRKRWIYLPNNLLKLRQRAMEKQHEKKERLYDETLQYISYMSSMTDILRVP